MVYDIYGLSYLQFITMFFFASLLLPVGCINQLTNWAGHIVGIINFAIPGTCVSESFEVPTKYKAYVSAM